MSHTSRARRFAKAFGVLLILGVLSVAALVGGLWIERSSTTSLPAPTGPFAVGRTTFDWVDAGHVDPVAPAPDTRREVLVWMWYPAVANSAPVDDYIPAQMRAAIDRTRGPVTWPAWVLGTLLTRDAAKVHSHSMRDAPIATAQPSYPITILRGGASVEVRNYSSLAEDLASHGYIVVGIDAPYRTGAVVFPDGRVLARTADNNPELLIQRNDMDRLNKVFAAWTSDISFVLDRLEQLNASDPSGKLSGRLDLSRVGVFGHSWGGAQAAQFCHDDARCKAVIDVDGAPFGSVVQLGLQQPFMFLFSGNGDFSTNDEVRQILANVQTMYDHMTPASRHRVAIVGGFHFTFTDDGAVLKSRLLRGILRVFGRLQIDGRRQLAVTAYCVRTFFDAYLKGAGASSLAIASPLYPELKILD